jgi:hypothetical protein
VRNFAFDPEKKKGDRYRLAGGKIALMSGESDQATCGVATKEGRQR